MKSTCIFTGTPGLYPSKLTSMLECTTWCGLKDDYPVRVSAAEKAINQILYWLLPKRKVILSTGTIPLQGSFIRHTVVFRLTYFLFYSYFPLARLECFVVQLPDWIWWCTLAWWEKEATQRILVESITATFTWDFSLFMDWQYSEANITLWCNCQTAAWGLGRPRSDQTKNWYKVTCSKRVDDC